MNITPVPEVLFKKQFADIPAAEVKLYLALLHLSLQRSQVQMAIGDLETFTGLSHVTLKKHRDNLIRRNFLEVLKPPHQHSPTIFGVFGGGCHIEGNILITPLPRDFDRIQIERTFWKLCFDAWLETVVTTKRNQICPNMTGLPISPGTHVNFFIQNIAPTIKRLSDHELWTQYTQLAHHDVVPPLVAGAPNPFGS